MIDVNSAKSIIEYAKKLEGYSLREKCGEEIKNHGYKGKGNFGQLLEKFYFGYEPNSDANPDFKEVGIELNLSCPNVIGKGQLAYDFYALEKYLDGIFKLDMKYIDIFGVKLPPYFELSHFETVAKILSQYPIDFITCINSIGNGLVIDVETDKPVIEPKNGLGGIGGSLIKPTSLANVYNFKKLLHNIDIIGCGGVTCGRDAFEHILCGASAVQIGTQYMVENVGCFDRIAEELRQIMSSKNYKNINEFKGKLLQ